MSFAMYRKIKSIVDAWNREERGKARVAAGAACALLVWLALFVAAAFFVPAYSILISLIGFLAWIVFVLMLIRRYLGAPRV